MNEDDLNVLLFKGVDELMQRMRAVEMLMINVLAPLASKSDVVKGSLEELLGNVNALIKSKDAADPKECSTLMIAAHLQRLIGEIDELQKEPLRPRPVLSIVPSKSQE